MREAQGQGQGREAERFEALKGRWQRAIEEGRLEEAARLIERAAAWADLHGDQLQVDGATCARAAVAIALKRGEAEVPRLREILLRSADPGNCRLAAYHLSVHYLAAGDYKKSAFYARIALERARRLGRPDFLASCHNQVGNILLSESHIEAAAAEYRQALALAAEGPGFWRAAILDNLGYCRVLQGDFGEGYALLYGSLRLLRRLGLEHLQAVVLLDLCFAHLETGRLRHALRCGAAGLAIAERTEQRDQVKNSLYLLGEAANLRGDQEEAHRCFVRLQQQFYPDALYLPGFLLAVDVRKLVNLHA
jgi:tetratricopeptide (TPR) repeat protein